MCISVCNSVKTLDSTSCLSDTALDAPRIALCINEQRQGPFCLLPLPGKFILPESLSAQLTVVTFLHLEMIAPVIFAGAHIPVFMNVIESAIVRAGLLIVFLSARHALQLILFQLHALNVIFFHVHFLLFAFRDLCQAVFSILTCFLYVSARGPVSRGMTPVTAVSSTRRYDRHTGRRRRPHTTRWR